MTVTEPDNTPLPPDDRLLLAGVFGAGMRVEIVPEYESADEFQDDLDYLRSLGATLLEHAGHRLPWPSSPNVEAQLLDNLTNTAYWAAFSAWPSFTEVWAEA